MKIKLEGLDNTPLTTQQCYNVLDNTTDWLHELVEYGIDAGDEDDELKKVIHFLSLVMDHLETLNKN